MNWNFQEILSKDPSSAWGCDTSGNIPRCGVAVRRTCRDVPSFTVLKTQICVTRPQCVKVQQIWKHAGHFIFTITPRIQFASLLLYRSLSQLYLVTEHFRTWNTRTETTRFLSSKIAQWRIQNCFHTDRFRNAIFKHTSGFTNFPFFAVPSWVVKIILHCIFPNSRAVCAVPFRQSDTLCERLTL